MFGFLSPRGGKQNHKITHISVANKVLGAIDDVVRIFSRSIAHRFGLHAAHIRTRIGFGHGQAIMAISPNRG